MENNNYVFQYNDMESIVIELELPRSEIHCCTEAPIFFYMGDLKFLLENWMISFNVPILSVLLTQALNRQLLLDASIKQDIGYLYAQYRFLTYYQNTLEQTGFLFVDQLNGRDWIGRKYLAWGHEVALWIYNDVADNIVLEFTPMYKGPKFDQEEEFDTLPFEQFLKTYKPLCTRILASNIAQQWLAQANSILDQIAANTARFNAEKS